MSAILILADAHFRKLAGRFNNRAADDMDTPASRVSCCMIAAMATEVDPAGLELRTILQAVDFRDARILEVGAGDGRLTFRYAGEPRSVVGIDMKEPEIRSAAKTARARFRGDARFLCASATALPFSAEEFEIVLLASSL